MDKNIARQAASLARNLERGMTLEKAGSLSRLTDWLGVAARLHALLGESPNTAAPQANAVRITDFGNKKISVIKTVREFTRLNVAEAKRLVELPNSVITRNAIRTNRSLDDLAYELHKAGATIAFIP